MARRPDNATGAGRIALPQDGVSAAARQARVVGIVIAATLVLWMGGQYLGGRLGWDPRYVFLMDFAALGGFVWALIVTWQIWRARRAK